MNDVNFIVNATFDRQFYWKGGDSVRYLVAQLQATQSKDDHDSIDPAPLNIALVIDASGSMHGGKLEAAKQAALGLTERLTDKDRITLVSFASDVRIHLDAVPATKENAVRIRSEIIQLHTRGSTALSEGWFAGVECAARVAENDSRMTPRVIILSDGHANVGIVNPIELKVHADEFRKRGVFTSALGIGDGYDEYLLRSIAENGGGRLHDIELSSEFSTVLLGELGDIHNTIVEGAEIVLTVPAGVRVDVLSRENFSFHDNSVFVQLGAIQNGIESVTVFKVTCPGGKSKDMLEFKLASKARTVNDQRLLEANPMSVSLAAANGTDNKHQLRDTKITAIVAKIWIAHIVLSAARMNRDRAYSDAKEYVERELHYFRPYVHGLDQGDEMVRELELLAQRVDRDISSRVRKDMTIQSHLDTSGRVDHRGRRDRWSTRMERGE